MVGAVLTWTLFTFINLIPKSDLIAKDSPKMRLLIFAPEMQLADWSKTISRQLLKLNILKLT